MNKTIRIEDIQYKQIQTRRGSATKVGVKGDDGIWYGCFKGRWNEGWAIGNVINIDYEIISSNGITYHNIQAPQSGYNNGPSNNGPSVDPAKIDKILQELEVIKLMLRTNAAPPEDEDVPF